MADDITMIRTLISDLGDPPILTDENIETFLSVEGGSVKRAAAAALYAIASSEALLSKVISTQDRSVDGAKVSDALRSHAYALRQQADKEEDEGFFMLTSIGPTISHEGEEGRF